MKPYELKSIAIILIGALVLVLVSCDSPSPRTTNLTSDTAIIVYETGIGGMIVRKIKVDGQEYLIANSTKGISIIRHDKPDTTNYWIPNGGGGGPSWDSTNTEAGDIMVGSGTIRSLTPKEQKETFGL